MTNQIFARKLHVEGIVQGVGFRPFICHLAGRANLKGEVANTPAGVTIHVEGLPEQISTFCRDITDQKPLLAHITGLVCHDVVPEGFMDFTIVKSRRHENRTTLISPDAATCKDCLREIFDPADRRFGYPFTNCTNCGPRYTIIDEIPYDRPNTSMKHFIMCDQCRTEYDSPANRRFHAQPNACPVCGPHVFLHDGSGNPVTGESGDVHADPLAATIMLLKLGNIVAIKGLGGFHVAVDANNRDAVERLRKRKHRDEKPFALMCADLEQVRQFAYVKPAEEKLLKGFQRPIVLLRKRRSDLIADNVSPGNRFFGVMLPSTPLHSLLFDGNAFVALVMTSGNLSEEPIAIDNADAFARLAGIADYFLSHNREIYLRSDDSIVRHAAGTERILRRSRGYVPVPVFLKKSVPHVLACGGTLKNTICLAKGKNAFLSQHIGDLDNLRTLDYFTGTIAHMKRILGVAPEYIAHDLHPDYLSTRYALEQTTGATLVPVQHHHAHIVSCMAENRIDGEVIGLAFDGTGFGTDGTIWGGEVLIADETAFQRVSHLSPVPLPGGEAAIKSPWRMGLSYLSDAMGDGFRNMNLPLLKTVAASDIDIVLRMITAKVNSPLTSSMGRLFDGAAAILGLRSSVSFEGQAAMAVEMEACADAVLLDPGEVYTCDLPDFSMGFRSAHSFPISVRPIIRGIVIDMQKGRPISEISTRFHWTLIQMFSALCDRIRRHSGLNRVVLSGGVFQNAILLGGMIRMLKDLKFDVYAHSRVPTNDGGISLGQAVIAGTRAL